MDIGAVFSIVGFVVAIVLLLPLLVGGVFVVVVVANRADPDPTGRRPALVYSLGTAFLTLFATLFATTAFVASLCRLFGSHTGARAYSGYVGLNQLGGQFGGHQHPLGDSVARDAVLSGLIAVITGLVCAVHLRAAARASAGAPTIDLLTRVQSSYVAAVSFVSVFIAVVASVVVLYDIFRGVAPGVFTSSGRGGSVDVLRSMVPAFYLAVASLAILFAHLRNAPPPFRPGFVDRWSRGPVPPTVEPEAPVSVLAPDAQTETQETPRAAPRKRAPRKATGE